MGTTWSVKLFCPLALSEKVLCRGIQRQLDLVDGQMSTWREDSDLSRFNRAPAGSWHPMPSHLRRVLDCALDIAEQSAGAYDPSIGAIVNLWGFGPGPWRYNTPDTVLLQQARQHCGWTRLRVDHARNALWQPGGFALDFSSIAKGYGVDLVVDYLRRQGVQRCLVEVGGELRGIGVKPDWQPWWVELEEPPALMVDRSRQRNIVALHDMALATSGDYRRYFDYAGRRYSHTIDPRTAQPVTHGLASVTVLHANCITADAWATALMVLGEEEGMRLATCIGLAALFVGRDHCGGYRDAMSPAYMAMLA